MDPRHRLASPLRTLLGSLLLVGCLALPASAGDDEPPAPVDLAALLEPIRAEHGVPALGAAVVRRSGLVAQGAVGRRAANDPTPVTVDDPWHIGSCTKAMTATLVARLVQRKLMRWDTTLAEVFPKLAPRMKPAWRTVTVEQLLRNRSGAPASLDADGLWGRLWRHEGSPTSARRMLLEGVVTRPPVHPPGTAYLYSNAGFALAGHMAETVAKTDYETLLQREVAKPLGITTLAFGAPGTPDTVDAPRGHRWRDGAWQSVAPGPGADNPPAITPAGRVHLTLADWGRFLALHLASEAGEAKPPLLDRSLLRRLQSAPEGQTYAMGWGLAERGWGGGRVLTHSGSNTMWFAVAWVAPRRDVAVLVTVNAAGTAAEKAADAAAGALVRRYAGSR